jgi:hypothetical protein
LYWVENLFTRKNHQIIVSKRISNSFYFKHCNLLFKFIFIQKCEYLNVSRLLTLKIVSLFIYYHIATLYRWLSFLWSSLSIYYLIYVVDAGKRKFIFSIFFMNLKAYNDPFILWVKDFNTDQCLFKFSLFKFSMATYHFNGNYFSPGFNSLKPRCFQKNRNQGVNCTKMTFSAV